MIKKVFALVALISAFMTMNAFAANTISSVSVSLVPDTTSLQPGDLIGGTEPKCTTGHTYIDAYNISTSDFSPKSSYTVEVKLSAKDGYTFTSPISVSAKGCTHVEISALSSESVTLKCKTYPIYRLLNPGNIRDDGGYAQWNKVTNASKYNVQIYYLNEDGNQKTASKSTTDTYYDYGEYLDQYGEAYVSVQAIPATNNSETKFMCGSEYIFAESGLTDTTKSPKSFSSFPSVSISKGKKGSSSSSNSSSSSSSKKSSSSSTAYSYSGNVGPGGPGNNADGWAGNGEAWVYLKNGRPLTSQWIQESDGNWYYVGSNGYMLLGWNNINDKWYYMNKSADRKIGAILSGWQLISDKWYYLEPSHNGNYGQLYVSCTTPDGHTVDANGALIQ